MFENLPMPKVNAMTVSIIRVGDRVSLENVQIKGKIIKWGYFCYTSLRKYVKAMSSCNTPNLCCGRCFLIPVFSVPKRENYSFSY